MDVDILEWFTDNYADDDKVQSVVAMINPNQYSPLIDAFDLLLLVIIRSDVPTDSTTHYSKDGYRIQERRVDPEALRAWTLSGTNRNIVQWIIQGEILLDRDLYLETLRHKLLEFVYIQREQKLLIEFSAFLRRYLQSKDYLKEGHLLDAYCNILEALHHWARIAIVDAKCHPEVTVWRQVRKMNPGIYKLYEELTHSQESLEKRVQLVLLACEFSVMTKMEECCSLIIRLLASRPEAWSVGELSSHPDICGLHVELPLLLNKLVKKHIIREVLTSNDPEFSMLEIRYTK